MYYDLFLIESENAFCRSIIKSVWNVLNILVSMPSWRYLHKKDFLLNTIYCQILLKMLRIPLRGLDNIGLVVKSSGGNL